MSKIFKFFKLKLFKKLFYKNGKRKAQQAAEESRYLLNRFMLMEKPYRGVQEEV